MCILFCMSLLLKILKEKFNQSFSAYLYYLYNYHHDYYDGISGNTKEFWISFSNNLYNPSFTSKFNAIVRPQYNNPPILYQHPYGSMAPVDHPNSKNNQKPLQVILLSTHSADDPDDTKRFLCWFFQLVNEKGVNHIRKRFV